MLGFIFDIIIYPIKLIIECIYVILSTSIFKGNVGIALAGLSLTVNLLCLPLYAKAEQLQQKERDIQKRMAKRIASIKRCFKGDEQYMILSMYYRENHYHPIMAMRSSLSLLIQIPFFIAAYSFLSHLDSLQGKSFFFLQDLSAPDVLLSFRFFSFSFSINVLPVLMTLINITAGLIYSKGFPLKERIQLYAMSLIFLILLYYSPSALVLYWTMNNIFSLAKNILFKIKNPWKTAYFVGLVLLGVFVIYVLFFRFNDPRRVFRNKALSALVFLLYAGIPVYLRFFRFSVKTWLYSFFVDLVSARRLFFLSCTSLWFLVACLIPLNLIASDPLQFASIKNISSPFILLLHPAVQAFGLLIFWPVYLFFLSPSKIKILFSYIFTTLSFCALLNFFVFQGNYGTVSRSLNFNAVQDLSGTLLIQIINILACIAIFILIYFLVRLKKSNLISICTTVCILSSFFLCISKLVHIRTVVQRNAETTFQNSTIIEGVIDPPIFTVSKTGKNIFVIMLDCAVNSYFPLFLEDQPPYRDKFDGFEYYPNTVSFFRNTIFGASPIFGGYEYSTYELNKRDAEKMKDKHFEAIQVLPRLFKNLQFDVTVSNMPFVYERSENQNFYNDAGIDEKNINGLYDAIYVREVLGLKEYVEPEQIDRLLQRNILLLSFLESSIYSLRDFIYQHGNYWSSVDFSTDAGVPSSTLSCYTTLFYLPNLTKITDEKVNYFSIFVNELPHEPSFLQYPNYTIEEKITERGSDVFGDTKSFKNYHVNAASYILLSKWFEYLRENNVWDNTRIIVVSDHGDTKITNPNFSPFENNHIMPYNPILLYKDFFSNKPLQIKDDFMTNADVPFLALKDINEDAVNPFTEKKLKQDKKDGIYIFLEGYSNASNYTGTTCLENNSKFYFINNSIFDSNNWKEVRYKDFKNHKNY
jgi:YidC/Oxa1 family membrane protein insertase